MHTTSAQYSHENKIILRKNRFELCHSRQHTQLNIAFLFHIIIIVVRENRNY